MIGRLEARNAASARVLEKLGLRREAHLVENEWVKGEWQSELGYAILADEWRAQRPMARVDRACVAQPSSGANRLISLPSGSIT